MVETPRRRLQMPPGQLAQTGSARTIASSTGHRIDVAIEPASLSELQKAGVSLYAFIAFETSNATAVPLVFQALGMMASMSISWTESYQGFVSATTLSAGVANPVERKIVPATSQPVRLGQALTVAPGSLQLGVTADGTSGAVTFRSGHSAELTCGLAYGATFAATCAASVVDGIDVVIAPLQSIYLMLSSSDFEQGTWVAETAGEGLIVDMAGAASRSVTFDSTADHCWREAAQGWAYPVAPGRDLPGLLRRPPPPNVPDDQHQERNRT